MNRIGTRVDITGQTEITKIRERVKMDIHKYLVKKSRHHKPYYTSDDIEALQEEGVTIVKVARREWETPDKALKDMLVRALYVCMYV